MSIDTSTGPDLLVFGAGGHGRVVADAALCSRGWHRVVASDRDDRRCVGELLPGVPLRLWSSLNEWMGQVHVAIGDNAARERESLALGFERLVTVVHARASVSPAARLATGCFVAAQSVVAPGARLGHGVIVNHAAVVDHDVVVDAFTHVAPGAVLGGGTTLGSNVLIGAGAVVLPGRSVCGNVVIGAAAVVCEDVTQPGTYIGTPARRIR